MSELELRSWDIVVYDGVICTYGSIKEYCEDCQVRLATEQEIQQYKLTQKLHR